MLAPAQPQVPASQVCSAQNRQQQLPLLAVGRRYSVPAVCWLGDLRLLLLHTDQVRCTAAVLVLSSFFLVCKNGPWCQPVTSRAHTRCHASGLSCWLFKFCLDPSRDSTSEWPARQHTRVDTLVAVQLMDMAAQHCARHSCWAHMCCITGCTPVHVRYPLQQHKPLAGGCCRVCVPQPCWLTPANIRQSPRAGRQHGGLGLQHTTRVGWATLNSHQFIPSLHVQLQHALAVQADVLAECGGNPKLDDKATLSTAGEDLYPANVGVVHEDPPQHKHAHAYTSLIPPSQTVQPLTQDTARMRVSAKVWSTVRNDTGVMLLGGLKAKRTPPPHECGCIYSDVTGGHLQLLLVLCWHTSLLECPGGMLTASGQQRQQQQAG